MSTRENIRLIARSSSLNYRICWTELVFEQYFNLLPYDLAELCHFRTLNHKLPVEHCRFFFWGGGGGGVR